MKKIALTQGKYALVDDTDFEWLNQWKWYFQKTTGYATRKPTTGAVLMHRLINQTPKGFETDHINRKRLDNRKANLRTVTRSQNCMNCSIRRDNKSGVPGVFWRPEKAKWSAYINTLGRRTYLGHYNNLQDAIKARKKGEERQWTQLRTCKINIT